MGAIGIPIGIAAGIAGIAVTLKSIGYKILETGMITGVSETNTVFKTVVPAWALCIIVILSVITIFISAYIPSKKASKITPIDAIRQTNEIKIKSKKLKTPKIIKAVFGYEGELAYKNLKRNGRKSRVITASIALSVVLFLCCNYFCDLFTASNDIAVNYPYQIMANVDYEDSELFSQKLSETSGVDDFYIINFDNYVLGKKSDTDMGENIINQENLTSAYKNLFNNKILELQ